jgi:hypothetical protein
VLCLGTLPAAHRQPGRRDGLPHEKLEDESRTGAKQSFVAEQLRRHQETPQVGRLLSLYVDDSVADPTPFGEVRQRAYKIMSRELLQNTAQRMSVKPLNKLALHWQAVDGLAERIRRHLRPLYVALDFAGTAPDNPWLAALTWASVFAKQQCLSNGHRRMSGGNAARNASSGRHVQPKARCGPYADRCEFGFTVRSGNASRRGV